IFNGIDNAEQALLAVRNMRYPQRKTSKYPDPPGLRGYAPGVAVWWWGVSAAEYERRADLWPLNPDGNLLAIMMIETTEGLKNAAGCRRDLRGRRGRSSPVPRGRHQLARSGAGV